MNMNWVDRACPLCGSRDESQVFVESNIDMARLDAFAFASRKLPEYMHPRLILCPGCGLLYASPALSLETLAGAYQAADFDSGEEAHYASATYAREVRDIVRTLPDRNGSLDIGTGDGAFLEELLNLGFQDVTGVEPSAAPIEAANPDIRKRIRPGLFRPEDFPPASFSLITCFQTMEHVWDPVGTARGALSLLKPGGAFVIVVHNRKAFSAKLLGLKSPIFDVEHLQLFCPDTARGLLERSGYQRVRVASLWNRYPLRYWMRLFPSPPAVKSALLSFVNASAVGKVPVSVPAGNLICVGYKECA
jgi:SAM-dependent methyltransferase